MTQYTPSCASHSNGVVERKSGTLLDMINSILISYGLPNNLLGEALYTACRILNRILYKTLYELWKNKRASYKYLKSVGCLAKVNIFLDKK